MSVRKWHPGKLIILWTWGAVCAALTLTHFLNSSVSDSPALHLCEILFVFVVLLVLSVVTWHWLGSKESG